jgi:RND family efflux transporter MFP subunit
VACHTAGRARSTAARRRAVERRAAERADIGGGGDDREEVAALIHEEVNRLPERYRSAVVLCDLEGRTCEEAARHLGCPVGTVGSRLSRGRRRLRDRLRRRGLAPRGPLDSAMIAAHALREPLPFKLVGSTADAAARFVSIAAIPQGTAASLARGVLRSMSLTRWWKVASVLLAVSASTTGGVALLGSDAAVADAQADDRPKAPPAERGAVAEITPGTLRVVVEERGLLQASRDPGVFSQVEGQVTIITLLPEGTRVTKGQLVCELDSSALKDQLTNQVMAIRKAEAAFETARLTREVAEMALQEYVEGIYPSELRAILKEIALAQSSVASAEERLKRTRIAGERLNAVLVAQAGARTAADIVAELEIEDRIAAAERDLEQGRRALEVGQARRDLLEKFTKDRTIKQLRIEVDKNRPVELAQQAACELERSREAKLRRQIDGCRLHAPGNGIVTYANDPSRFRPSIPMIEEGAAVRERQKIFSVHDLDGPMRVEVKIPEAIVDRLSPGLTAQIRVDAFADKLFQGIVEDVAPLPDPTFAFNNPGIKVYTTHVAIKDRIPGLRPGMSARVEILVTQLEGVLSVPVEAVVSYDGEDHVGVKTEEGRPEWRTVTLGLSNDQRVEVRKGLKAGEVVVLKPVPLLSEEQKRKAFGSPKPSPKTKTKTNTKARGAPGDSQGKAGPAARPD